MTGGQTHVKAGTFSAMLLGIPEVAEQQAKGNTPRESWPARNSQRVHLEVNFDRFKAVAFACAYVTRHRQSGQRPGQPGFSPETQKTESKRVGGSK